MGRVAAVTYEQAAAAAEQLSAEGLIPTAKLLRLRLGRGGSNGTFQNYIKKWRAEKEGSESVIRILAPEIQRAIFKFIDEEISRTNSELAQQVEQAESDMADMAADNEEQYSLVCQLRAELAEQATFIAKQDGHLARLHDELHSAREETSVMRREAEMARLETSRLEARLQVQASVESELRQLRTDFEMQRQACVHAEQDAAVLKAQKDILEAQVAELKEAASAQAHVHVHGGNAEVLSSKKPPRTPPPSARRGKRTEDATGPVMQGPEHAPSSATHAAGVPSDPRQAKLC